MAVYTHLSLSDIQTLLATHYPALGACLSARPIAEGIENSNYLVECQKAEERNATRYILTLFEKRIQASDMPFYMGVMETLDSAGLSVPLPQEAVSGARYVRPEENNYAKPISVVSFLEGKPMEGEQLSSAHMASLGAWIGQLHQQAEMSEQWQRENALGLEALSGFYDGFADTVRQQDSVAAQRIEKALVVLRNEVDRFACLPKGLIHADLFPDNVFFEVDSPVLSGVIDWYFACVDCLAYDVAITLTAWCFDENGHKKEALAGALMQGYEGVRPLSALERDAFSVLCLGAALRFYLTRLYDWIHHDENALVTPKNPTHYAQIVDYYLNAI